MGEIWGCARVSTDDQNPGLQVDALDRRRRATQASGDRAHQRRGQGPAEVRRADRAPGDGDILMVWKVDRLGRSTLTALETAQRLDKAGVRIVVTTLGADLKTSSGRLVLGVLVQLRRVPERMQDAEAAALAKAGEKARDRAKGYIGEYQKGWPPLAESTVTEKTALGYSPPDNPLLRTGDMRTLSTCPSSRDGW